MAADALVSCVTRSSAARLLSRYENRSLYQCWEMIDNANVFHGFLKFNICAGCFVSAAGTTVRPQAASTGQVQNLRIIQGPNGQIQVQGLLPGEWLGPGPGCREEMGGYMTPTHQALPLGRCSPITGQVVQQVAEVVRLGPLNCTVGCPCMQDFLTLEKMHV